MKMKLMKLLVSPFWFSLILGLITIAVSLWDIRISISKYQFQLVIGFFLGLGLGLVVFLIEKWVYVHHSLPKSTTQYQATSLSKVIYILFLLGIILYSKNETGYMLAFASGIYLLTLAAILFQVRKTQDIFEIN